MILVYEKSLDRVFVCFFFSSRRRHTRFDCDWSSDVCSSDLKAPLEGWVAVIRPANVLFEVDGITEAEARESMRLADRKSTRLNSSHSQISYAVFCLKKKKNLDQKAHPIGLHSITSYMYPSRT